jgi:protein-tyrosine sulfotransferase
VLAEATVAEGILVLGAPRSGTTLVRRLLDAHPDVAVPPETQLFTASARFLADLPMGTGAAFGVRAGLAQAGFPEDEVLARVRALAFGFLRDHAARAGKPRWAEKTTVNTFHLREIEALCGDHVQYVVLVRHGLDAAASTEELFAKTGAWFAELHAYLRTEHRPLVALARAWADGTTALLDLRDRRPGQVHVVRYEDLVADPVSSVGALLAFLGLPDPGDLVGAALARPAEPGFGDWKTWATRAVHTDSVGRWRKLDRALVGAMLEACAPVLARAGYPPVPALDAEAARKRAERALHVAQLRAGRPDRP